MLWYAWYDIVWYDPLWHGSTFYGAVEFAFHGAVWFGIPWCSIRPKLVHVLCSIALWKHFRV